MRFKPLILCIFLLLSSQLSRSQYYETGQDPSRLKWLQIKTDRFKVIYPEKYGPAGIEFTKSLERAYSDISPLFPEKKFRIPVIIHNFTTQSNGYVAWAPRRMEIFPTPEQNSIPLDPDRQLALHELTHVMQMKSLSSGFSKSMSVIFGEQFPGAVASLLPLWYMEGHAVFAETYLTASGRGRSAAFQKQLKAIAVERGEMYKYDKIVNGSYKDHVPDHYQSGYQMVAWSLTRYNRDIWNKTLKMTANAPFLINPVNLSLRASSDLTKKKLYTLTFDTLTKAWKEDIVKSGAKTYDIINPDEGNKYTSYHSPVKVGENSYAAIKTSLSRSPEIVLLNRSENTEEKIQVPGRMYPYFISAAQRLLVWVEYQNDPRWENRNYSVIKMMDLRDRIIKQISRASRYMSVSVSPDMKTIAALENSPDNINNLVFINVSSAKVLKSVPTPGNAYLQKLQWSHDGSQILAITLTENGEGIISYSTDRQSWTSLIPESPTDYQSVCLRNDSLFYVSSASGTENIYTMTPGKEIIQLTNSKFGATDVSLDGGKLIFSDYSYGGSNICIAELENSDPGNSNSQGRGTYLIDQVKPVVNEPVIDPGKKYVPERYRKPLHLFNFHSWMPFYADLEAIQSDPLDIKPGFTIFSQNQLSTLISSIGYEYSDKLHKLHSNISWKGWYPVLETKVDYGHRPLISKLGLKVDDPVSVKPGMTMTNRLSVPLTFSSGRFIQYLNPSISSVYKNNYIFDVADSLYDNEQTELSGRLYFSNYHIYSQRDIYPRLAQIIDLNFSLYPSDKKFYGSMISLRAAFYFPGFFPNNGIRIRYESDIQTFEKFVQFNRINLPRGYKDIISEDLKLLTADYVFPIIYPDLNILSLLYLKRLRADIFYDIGRGTNNYYLGLTNGGYSVKENRKFTETFSSQGFELLADFHLLRIPFQMSGGFQAAWKSFNDQPVIKVLFNVDIYGMTIGKAGRKPVY